MIVAIISALLIFIYLQLCYFIINHLDKVTSKLTNNFVLINIPSGILILISSSMILSLPLNFPGKIIIKLIFIVSILYTLFLLLTLLIKPISNSLYNRIVEKLNKVTDGRSKPY